jgi:hypothetical protein
VAAHADRGRDPGRGGHIPVRRHGAAFDRISGNDNVVESVQGIEASLNTIILASLGFLALVRTEERIKRKQVFKQLHGLRSLIHVIDMHQLTKDPAALSPGFKRTEHSPQRMTDADDLARYLDYCSEMLSITGKLAALYAQAVNDEIVIEAVNDIEGWPQISPARFGKRSR